MSVATVRQLDDLPIMDELDAPDWGVDFSWVTDDLFAREYQGLMRSSWGDVVAYRNADVEALVAHPQVSHQGWKEQIEPFRPPGSSDDFGMARFGRGSTFVFRPPDHAPLKKLVTRPLTPKAVSRFGDTFTAVVRSLVDEAVDRDQIDFVQDFVKPSLFGFWGPALGLSREEVAHGIEAGGDLMQSFRVAPNEEEIAATNRGGDEFVRSVASWIERAGRSGHYPFVADLARQYAALDERLRTDTQENFLAVGILDGFHTIVPMLASCAFAFIEAGIQPAAQPDAVSFAAPAFEEASRLHTAVTFTQRQATEDFVHDGVLISRDTNINMMWLFGNRDPEVFAEPMEYRLDRSNRAKQFGFGGGPYVCAGRHLAKGLGELMLGEFVRADVTIELVGDVEWVPGSMIHEYKAFPVAIRCG